MLLEPHELSHKNLRIQTNHDDVDAGNLEGVGERTLRLARLLFQEALKFSHTTLQTQMAMSRIDCAQ